jgi:hypothetical protein
MATLYKVLFAVDIAAEGTMSDDAVASAAQEKAYAMLQAGSDLSVYEVLCEGDGFNQEIELHHPRP